MKAKTPDLKEHFARILLKWNKEKNSRQMPWKGEKDPYRIWLSEIILQQTRVEQGLGYYNRFLQAFPDIHHLAGAADERVFKLWEGLGYYSRCRNLIASARYIVKNLDGKFPSSYESIKELKGVGPYTASAICSFAYNLPHAVVDGNVYRVLARIFGISLPVNSVAGKKGFDKLAHDLLKTSEAGKYNQAIMDFGAVVCKPVAPACETCVFRKNCFAFINDRIDELPVKDKKPPVKKRWFYYVFIEKMIGPGQYRFAIRQRRESDIWKDLFEFPLVEAKIETEAGIVLLEAEKNMGLRKKQYSLISVSPLFRQQLSHQLIAGRFIRIRLKQDEKLEKDWLWVSKEQLGELAFPRYINQFLSKAAVN
jgi:A/G-specific adenine glycosylase